MNIRKFLAIKIAEQAAEISNQAEHVADCHADSVVCREDLLTDILEFAALAIVAQQNGLFPVIGRERTEQIKLDARRALMREAFNDMMRGELVGELVI